MTLRCATSIGYRDGEEVNSADIQLSANGTLGGDSFAVYASNNWDASLFPAWHMFDGDDSTDWFDAQAPVDVIFYNPTPIRLDYLIFHNRNGVDGYTFTAGTLYGSNDNITYEIITNFTNSDSYGNSGIEVLNGADKQSRGYYKYYKFHFTAETLPGTGISNIFFNGYEAESVTLYNPLVYETSTPVYSSNYQGTGSTDSSTGYTTAGTDTLTPFGANGTLASNYGLDKEFYIQVKFKASQWNPYYNADSVQIFNMYNRNKVTYPIQFGRGQDGLFAFMYTRQMTNCYYNNAQTNTWYIFKVWCKDELGEVINFGIYDENGIELSRGEIYSTYGDFQNAEVYFLDIYGFINGTGTRNYQGYITYDGYNTYIARSENSVPKWRMANKSQTINIKMSNPDYVAPPTPPTPSEVTVTDLSSYDEFGSCYIHSFQSNSDVYTAAFTTDTGITASPASLMTGGVAYTCYWDFPRAIQLTDFAYNTTGTSGSWTVFKRGKVNGIYSDDLSDISTSNPVLVEGVYLQFYSNAASPNMPVVCKNMTIKYLTGGN